MRFLLNSILGRIIGVLGLLAIGAVVLLLTEGDGERPMTNEQKTQVQIDKSISDLNQSADAISSGVQLATLRTNLQVTGRWEQYRIKRIEPNNGGYTIQTSLPPGQDSIGKVNRLCEDLLGGDPPEVDSPGGLLVFGTGPEPLSGESCGQGP